MALLTTLADLADGETFDLIVIGAGGAGLSTAVHAGIDGARVLVIERTAHVGGTTAWSAGTTWIPLTRHAATVGEADTLERVERYLDTVVGPQSDPALRRAMLSHGAEAVERFEQHTDVHFRAYPLHPDYESDIDGATLRGRALEPLPFDGRQLGPLFDLLRPPIPEFTVLGGMMVDRTDINHLLNLTGRWASFRHALKILSRHAMDRLSHPRGTRLVMGNALVGRLLRSLSRQPMARLLMQAEVTALTSAPGGPAGGVTGVRVTQGGLSRRLTARGGVVLASGGFNRHPQLRAQWLPGIDERWCAGAPGHTGALQALVQPFGAHWATGAKTAAFWAPVSIRPRPDGSTAVFPHFVMDRAKPGMVTVDAAGRRFVNESTSYHRFGLAMQAAQAAGRAAIPAFLVCDAAALKRYGIGMVRPGGKGLAPFLADGYLTEGRTLDELAQKLGIDPTGLRDTVAQMNSFAREGQDPQFQRGVTAYQRNIGDAAAGHANANLGPIETAPFYAVRLYPGDIGAAMGLETDAAARVRGTDGQPIPGLYAVGNDMQSMMGGAYPGPGITVGPGMVFGYLAARDAVGRGRRGAAASD